MSEGPVIYAISAPLHKYEKLRGDSQMKSLPTIETHGVFDKHLMAEKVASTA